MVIPIILLLVSVHIIPFHDHYPLPFQCTHVTTPQLQQLFHTLRPPVQAIPITFSLDIISCKLSHPSLPSSDSLVDHYSDFHVLFLSDISSWENPNSGSFQLFIYLITSPKQLHSLWRKVHNHTVCYFKWALRSAWKLSTCHCDHDLPFPPSSNLQPSPILLIFSWGSHFLL